MSDGGKGDAPRPFSVPLEVFDTNHERIFGKRERQQYVPPPLPQGDKAKQEDSAT
jgi:hypothetical protein